MIKRKLIFIDIDGVLNNKKDGTSYFCFNPETYGLSEKNMDVLRHILKETDAKLVLSTSWRNHDENYAYPYHGKEYKSPLKKFIDDIGPNNFFTIPKAPHLHKHSKASDIEGFFYVMKEFLKAELEDTKFAVLDDQTNQGLHIFGSSFFCIDLNNGLTMNDAESIIFHLNGVKDYEEQKI